MATCVTVPEIQGAAISLEELDCKPVVKAARWPMEYCCREEGSLHRSMSCVTCVTMGCLHPWKAQSSHLSMYFLTRSWAITVRWHVGGWLYSGCSFGWFPARGGHVGQSHSHLLWIACENISDTTAAGGSPSQFSEWLSNTAISCQETSLDLVEFNSLQVCPKISRPSLLKHWRASLEG